MSDDDNVPGQPNGDEDFKKFLKETSEGTPSVDFLLSVNDRKLSRTITLMRLLQSAYGKLPDGDPMRKKLLSFNDQLVKTAKAGLNFYDLIIFQEHGSTPHNEPS